MSDESGKLVCKWYEPVLSRQNGHVRYNGKYAFTLSVKEKEGYNHAPQCESTLSAVRMIPHMVHSCFLLWEDDRLWAEEELGRIQAHNKKLHQAKSDKARAKMGKYMQNIRPGHDALKANKMAM